MVQAHSSQCQQVNALLHQAFASIETNPAMSLKLYSQARHLEQTVLNDSIDSDSIISKASNTLSSSSTSTSFTIGMKHSLFTVSIFVLYNEAVCYLRLGMIEDAISKFKTALDKDPFMVIAALQLATIYFELNLRIQDSMLQSPSEDTNLLSLMTLNERIGSMVLNESYSHPPSKVSLSLSLIEQALMGMRHAEYIDYFPLGAPVRIKRSDLLLAQAQLLFTIKRVSEAVELLVKSVGQCPSKEVIEMITNRGVGKVTLPHVPLQVVFKPRCSAADILLRGISEVINGIEREEDIKDDDISTSSNDESAEPGMIKVQYNEYWLLRQVQDVEFYDNQVYFFKDGTVIRSAKQLNKILRHSTSINKLYINQ